MTKTTTAEKPAATLKRHRWYARRVGINRAGYDSVGNYWGTGAPLYFIYREDGAYDFYLRGTRSYEMAAAQWAEFHSDTAAACRFLNSNGRIGERTT